MEKLETSQLWSTGPEELRETILVYLPCLMPSLHLNHANIFCIWMLKYITFQFEVFVNSYRLPDKSQKSRQQVVSMQTSRNDTYIRSQEALLTCASCSKIKQGCFLQVNLFQYILLFVLVIFSSISELPVLKFYMTAILLGLHSAPSRNTEPSVMGHRHSKGKSGSS